MWPFLQTTKNNCGCSTKTTYNQCGCNMLSSNSISYNGPELACVDVQLCDTLTDVLQKIDAKVCSTGTVVGTGTNNYLARWTPNGTTLGIGLIQDNNNSLSIGTSLDPNVLLGIETNKIAGIVITNTNTTNVIRNAISASTNGVSSAENRGIEALAINSTLLNTGVSGNAISDTGSKAVGGSFNSAGAGTNYSLQLRDGTQATGKVLTCMTVEGESNWGKVTSDYTTGATGSFTSQDGKTVTVTNGLITSIV